MQVSIAELVDSAGLEEGLYPGKKLVKKYQLTGSYKSHCMVFDWSDSGKLHVELRAGVSGKTLDPQELKHYPVSFQAPTYVDIAVESNDDDDEDKEDEDDKTAKGKGGGGGKKPAKKKEKSGLSLSAFGKVTEGKVPEEGEITKFVVMGKELAKEAFETAFENLKEQLGQTKIMTMDLMKGVANIIKKATPGGGLEAKGDEKLKYKYDIEKNGTMFGAAPS